MAGKSKMRATASEKKTVESASSNKSSKVSLRKVSKTAGIIIGLVIVGSIAVLTTLMVLANTTSLRSSRAEYEILREVTNSDTAAEYHEFNQSALDEEMRQINHNYVGWLRIDGTSVDYPVVRGDDNERYLNTSFNGEESLAGAIFMDYRIHGDFLVYRPDESIPHIILYGHNVPQGGMFSDLQRLFNDHFLEENRIITFIVDGVEIEFEIFSVRMTDIHDPAYFLDFDAIRAFPRSADRINAPLHATQIITLSTCTRGGDDDARIIVQGYRLLG